MTYSVGMQFKFKNTHTINQSGTYILACTQCHYNIKGNPVEVCLINMETGNRFTDSQRVKTASEISDEVFNKLCGRSIVNMVITQIK